jgi:hypothetical protein
VQKRFAWLIGLILAVPMFYIMVIHPQPSLFKIPLCIVCLTLLFFESAFSICVGCKVYGWISKEPLELCPGEVCTVRAKDPVQRFSLGQTIITALTVTGLITGAYLYFTRLDNRTFMAEKFRKAFMTQAQIEAEELKAAEAEFDADDEDDF